MMTLGPDLALDLTTHDLLVTRGDLALTVSAAQAVSIRLLFFLNDWFLNTLIGLPYFQQIFVKNPDLDQIRALYRAEIAASPGILEVTSVDLALNASSRRATLRWTALGESGAESGLVEVV